MRAAAAAGNAAAGDSCDPPMPEDVTVKGSNIDGGKAIEKTMGIRTCGVARRTVGMHCAPPSAESYGRPGGSAGKEGERGGEEAEEERASSS